MSDDIVRAEVEIELLSDKWLVELSKKFPNLSFNILSMSLIQKDVGNILVQVQGENTAPLFSVLNSHHSILGYYIISKTPTTTLLNVKVQNPLMYISSIENEILLKYPIQIRNGWAKWEIYSPRENINSFIQKLQLKEINMKLISIGKHKEKIILTPRQAAIMNMAMREGFYEVPRKINLSELASKLNISKSNLSEILRRLNKKLLKFNQ